MRSNGSLIHGTAKSLKSEMSFHWDLKPRAFMILSPFKSWYSGPSVRDSVHIANFVTSFRCPFCIVTTKLTLISPVRMRSLSCEYDYDHSA